jgi:hypothetical protein
LINLIYNLVINKNQQAVSQNFSFMENSFTEIL